MKIINREVGYAIRSLCFMFTEQDEVVTTGYLSSYFNISRSFLRKIFQKLNRAGILESYKGKKGGYKPVVHADKISLLDLIEVFQGKFRLSNCYGKEQQCPIINDCQIREEIENVEKNLIGDLSKISLKTLINKNEKKILEEKEI